MSGTTRIVLAAALLALGVGAGTSLAGPPPAGGEKVTLTGFGSFQPYRRQAGKRINPRTGQLIQVPAKTVPKFRAGKQFKDALGKKK